MKDDLRAFEVYMMAPSGYLVNKKVWDIDGQLFLAGLLRKPVVMDQASSNAVGFRVYKIAQEETK